MRTIVVDIAVVVFCWFLGIFQNFEGQCLFGIGKKYSALKLTTTILLTLKSLQLISTTINEHGS